MTQSRLSFLIAGSALLLALVLHLADLPSGNKESSRNQERDHIIAQYLLFKDSPNTDFDAIEPILKRYEKRNLGVEVTEALILCYGLQDNKEKARQLARFPNGNHELDAVKYALDLGDQLPDNWANAMKADWAGAKITSMIYERKGMEKEFAESLIHLRHYEAKLKRDFRVSSWNMMLCVFGAGLLFSMWLSSRQWRRLGENFFRLKSLSIPVEDLTRFFGLFLLGFMLAGFLVDLAFGGFSPWLQHAVGYLLQMAWGVYLLKKQIFKATLNNAAEALGFANLRMRFISIFQIFGGLAILVFMNAVTGFLEGILHWPQSNIDLDVHYSTLFDNPFVAIVFLFISCILGPLFEEILFRGLLLRGLMERVSPSTAICISAFCFSILHPLTNWPSVFLMEIGLGIVYYRTSNLLVNIWSHALWNGLVIWLSHIGGVY